MNSPNPPASPSGPLTYRPDTSLTSLGKDPTIPDTLDFDPEEGTALAVVAAPVFAEVEVMDFDPEAPDDAAEPVPGKAPVCPAPDASGNAPPPASPPVPKCGPPRHKKSRRLEDGGTFLKDQSCNVTEFFFGPYVNASRRFWRCVDTAIRDANAGLEPNYSEIHRLLELKREFARIFKGVNILHPAVSAAANPHLRRHDFPRLRYEMAMVSLRAEVTARCNPKHPFRNAQRN